MLLSSKGSNSQIGVCSAGNEDVHAAKTKAAGGSKVTKNFPAPAHRPPAAITVNVSANAAFDEGLADKIERRVPSILLKHAMPGPPATCPNGHHGSKYSADHGAVQRMARKTMQRMPCAPELRCH